MDVKPHGLSGEAACRVYQHVKQQGDFSIAELRDAVNHAEPVLDSRATGGLAASRKDMDVMPDFGVLGLTQVCPRTGPRSGPRVRKLA